MQLPSKAPWYTRFLWNFNGLVWGYLNPNATICRFQNGDLDVRVTAAGWVIVSDDSSSDAVPITMVSAQLILKILTVKGVKIPEENLKEIKEAIRAEETQEPEAPGVPT